MKEVKPFENYSKKEWTMLVPLFLAGSIEQGTADNWQVRTVESLKDKKVLIFNPRRDNWDATLEQSKENEELNKQVNWELDHISLSELVCFYFDPNTKSPVTLLELGLCLPRKDVTVYCPRNYWRKGNVDITCERYGVKVYEDEAEWLEAIKSKIDELNSWTVNEVDYRSDWRG